MSPHAVGRILADVPVLLAEPPATAALLPVVLWHHGFRADALAHAGEIERCAAAGFFAVGVDAVDHGARHDPTLSDRVAASPHGALPIMLEQVERTIAELPALLDALAALYPIDRTRVSMVGISMGAFLTYRAIAEGLPLRAAVALLGTPNWGLHARSPHRNPDAFRRTALLSVTAELDASVPPTHVGTFHQTLRDTAPPATLHPHHHFVLRGAGHLTNAEEWQLAMRVTRHWLRRWG
jgi:uncharacterized protein